jgi:hypothetical protein
VRAAQAEGAPAVRAEELHPGEEAGLQENHSNATRKKNLQTVPSTAKEIFLHDKRLSVPVEKENLFKGAMINRKATRPGHLHHEGLANVLPLNNRVATKDLRNLSGGRRLLTGGILQKKASAKKAGFRNLKAVGLAVTADLPLARNHFSKKETTMTREPMNRVDRSENLPRAADMLRKVLLRKDLPGTRRVLNADETTHLANHSRSPIK